MTNPETPSTALKRLIELEDAASTNGADPDTTVWDDAVAAGRAALKAEPERPSLADIRQLCVDNELLMFVHAADFDTVVVAILEIVRTALSRWGRPAAAAPAPGENLPSNYIDREHTGQDRELLEAFYRACAAEGGTADEIHLRGIKAVLAACSAAPPSPEPGPSDEQIEDAAKLIYASMRFAVSDSHGACDWVERGNSLMQDEARRTARAVLNSQDRPVIPAAPPAPESEEMQGLVIDLTEVSLVLDEMKKPRLAAALTRAAMLLKQQDIELATLRAVPVTMSPGLAEKVYLDTEGRCWHFMPGFPGVAPEWRLIRPDELGPYDTHVAAASAIPLPAPQFGEVQL